MSTLPQGFRKIGSDKWEFANEGFVRGERHLLKTIKRRKSHHPSNEDGKLAAALEGEIETLRNERSSMMEEVIELQHQQRGTVQHMKDVNKKVEAAERGNKQIVSFLAKMFDNPAFFARITNPRRKRKFVEHQPCELVKYQPGPHMGDFAECRPSGVEDECMVNELLHAPEDEISFLTLETSGPTLEQNVVISPQMQTESPVVTEEAGVFGSTYDYLLGDYNVPDLGIDCGLPDVWEGCLGIERWLDEDLC